MDVFKFNSPVSPTKLQQGEIVNNLKSKMWIERYRDAGEFSFVADASTGMREILPIGTFISHVDTTEVMVVENHEITDDGDSEPEITITGRGFETIFEQRVLGSNKDFVASPTPTEYVLSANPTWLQVAYLINDHIQATSLLDDDNALPYVTVESLVGGTGDEENRSIKKSDLYKAVLDLLAVDNLGIRIFRPGLWAPIDPGGPNVEVIIHKGTDRSADVVLSYDSGEIESADYLWSNKLLKNAAVVSGRWAETFVDTAETGYSRRVMYVDASDLDNAMTEAPTGPALTALIAAMQQRGIAALAAQNELALTKVEVSKNTTKAVYRTDYEVGDIITAQGHYDASAPMRVSEYVEIEDETGASGQPTLTTP